MLPKITPIAKDKATNKQQSIVIHASSGLSEDEIQRMAKDAEEHADDDKVFHELVMVRNQADALIHSVKKTLKEVTDIDAEEKERIESALKALEEAVRGEDKADIEAKSATLSEVSNKLAERMYANQANQEQQQEPQAEAAAEAKSDDGNVVDAEFEEVNDDKK